MKIIPAIDLMDGQVVRLLKGDPSKKTIYNNEPIEIAKKWENAGADLIHLVDLDATLGRGSNLDLIKKIVGQLTIPVQVAGGLRDKSIISEVLQFSTRIVIGTLAFKQKDSLKEILDLYGKEKIVIAVDHNNGSVVINGWQNDTGIKLIDAVNDFVKLGFSEFLITNVDKDGTLAGPDLEFLSQACDIVGTNIIASGGISKIDDVKFVKNTNAYGVILGKALYENLVTIEEAKQLS